MFCNWIAEMNLELIIATSSKEICLEIPLPKMLSYNLDFQRTSENQFSV